MRPFLFVALLAFAFAPAHAQIKFERMAHEFGTIQEAEGEVTTTFKFTNSGSSEVRITTVDVECGCTTPDYSKDPIPADSSGFITATFNPENQPGVFDKKLTVTAIGHSGDLVLHIKGMVVPRPRTPEQDFPTKIGALRVESRYLKLGTITTEKPVSKAFAVYNDSDTTLTFDPKKFELPAHIQIKMVPQTLPPKTQGKLELTFDPAKKNDLGDFLKDPITLVTTEKVNPKKELKVMLSIEEYFPARTGEKIGKQPKVAMVGTKHNFGYINQNQKVETIFSFVNTGQEPLKVRSVKPNCDCVTYEVKTPVVEPGKTGTLVVSFDPAGREGTQKKQIYLYTNAEDSPVVELEISAEVR